MIEYMHSNFSYICQDNNNYATIKLQSINSGYLVWFEAVIIISKCDALIISNNSSFNMIARYAINRQLNYKEASNYKFKSLSLARSKQKIIT